ncbi:MAG: helix-turn-helix domain-containing protein [Mogibacterium diversum]|uniref:LexA family protein n=1 Tax=Mogibacterium diversum TaxID=114527 RepID=UPI00206F00B2|nr:S24 family peptidase [Mogibacterium diversum]UQF81335.1 MAG: helix-turn-helix domain-containing protein [Mogibacterium diversum]
MGFSNNIRFLRKQRNLTQEELAEMVGYKSFTTIQKWETGDSEPNMGVLRQLADIFHLSISELVETDLESKATSRPLPSNIITPAAYAVPILGTICAGSGIHCEENFQGHFYVDHTIKADYCLKVKGDSMIDAGIYDGDFAFIRKSFDYSDGDIYAVCWGAEESASLKKLYKMDDKVMLQPCNSDHAPTLVDADDIYIVGECIGTYHAR